MSISKNETKINQRKIYLINPSFQLRVCAYSLALSFIIISTFYISISLFFYKFKNQGITLHLPPDHVFFRFLEVQNTNLNMTLLIASIVITFITIILGIIYTHHIAGPLYKLNKHFTSIAEQGGPMKEVRFRQGDCFKELEESFNKMVNSLNKTNQQ
ncbi:MAG: hypothetical protein HQK51_00915 [Oligoflexia bacterium]|nr:hypothetical protein [Oligoflexia bacterium]